MNVGRCRYPFNEDNEAAFYMSEYEEDDEDEYTLSRRTLKDELEEDLREIDTLKNTTKQGDEDFMEQFGAFEKRKRT